MPGYRKNIMKRMRMRCHPPQMVSWPYYYLPPQPLRFNMHLGVQPAMFSAPPVTLALQQLALQQLALRQLSLQQLLSMSPLSVSSPTPNFPPNPENISNPNDDNIILDRETASETSAQTSPENPTADCHEDADVDGNATAGDQTDCIICLKAPAKDPYKCDQCTAVSCWICLEIWIAHAGTCPMCRKEYDVVMIPASVT